MISTEFILCNSDVAAIADALSAERLSVIYNERLDAPKICCQAPSSILRRPKASFYALRKEWQYGELVIRELANTVTGGKYYDLSPRVNFWAISLSFYPESIEGNIRKLGFGGIDAQDTWLKAPENELNRAPADASRVCKKILAHLREGGTTLATPYGKKIVMRHALEGFLNRSYIFPHAWLDKIARNSLTN
jgi:hypothetical protein